MRELHARVPRGALCSSALPLSPKIKQRKDAKIRRSSSARTIELAHQFPAIAPPGKKPVLAEGSLWVAARESRRAAAVCSGGACGRPARAGSA
eukprot:833476-Prymnesium_polylepis.1